MSQNIIHSTVAKDAAGSSEPVTVGEAKLHAAIDYADYDTVIPIYLQAAREMVERATGYALVEKEVVSHATIGTDFSLELTFAPLSAFTSIKPVNEDGSLGDSLDSTGFYRFGTTGTNIFVTAPGIYEIKYKAKLDPVPASLKLAVLHQFNHIFVNRGDSGEAGGISKEALEIIGQWRRFNV